MSPDPDKKTWLEGELAAVITKLAEVETAKTAYDLSYEIAKERLLIGKSKLLELVNDQD